VTIRSDDAVVVDSNRDGLSVAKTASSGVASRASVIVVQTREGIEPKKPAQVGARRIHWPAKTLLDAILDSAGKAQLLKPGSQFLIRCRSHFTGSGLRLQKQRAGCEEPE
jgi:hypothetical protein